MNKRTERIANGNCPSCGEWAYPYYYCKTCRIKRNISRVLNSFEKKGWVDIKLDPKTNKKSYKWNNTAPENISKNYTPETMAKMSLPRLKGKPMTDEVVAQTILDVLGTNMMPLTTKEIQRGFKSLKTIGKVIPERESLIREYKLIKLKQSNLSKSQRDGVELRISFLLKHGTINESDL